MYDLDSLLQRLKKVRHFQDLPEADLKTIINSGQILRFSANSVLFHEGEPCAGLFVLFSGRLRMCKMGPQGQEFILALIQPVIMVNEVSVLDGGPNPLTAIAAQDCVTWQVGYDRFQILMQRYPQIGLGLLRVLAARNRMLLERYEDLSSRSVIARTAKLLLDLSDYGRYPIHRIEHNNNLLAARAATVHEAISRTLKLFRDHDCITTTRQEITITSPERLVELAQLAPEFFKN
ncbi:MAG: Crp/Fnr family transcriptional regulator [Anaerolineales bacterium]|nr:Crp/Fnr family transcriptional regulator [Anaerolineales bacterium]